MIQQNSPNAFTGMKLLQQYFAHADHREKLEIFAFLCDQLSAYCPAQLNVLPENTQDIYLRYNQHELTLSDPTPTPSPLPDLPPRVLEVQILLQDEELIPMDFLL